MEFHFHDQIRAGDATQHFVDGEHVGTRFEHLFGGYEYMDPNGESVALALKNAQGGHDIFVDGRLESSTTAHEDGGMTITDENLIPVAQSMQDDAGNITLMEEGQYAGMIIGAEESGFQSVMQMSDPLRHIHLYHMPSLIWG